MRTVYYYTAFFLFTIVAFVVFIVVWLSTVPFDRDRKVIHLYSRFWGKTIYRIFPWWKVRIEGTENIEKDKAYVVLSNHQSMLDIPLLYRLPLDFKWVSKKEVYYIPIFGTVLWMHGDVAIERGGVASAKRMITKADALLKRGLSIIMFPEGTRTKDGRVRDFQPGACLLAKKSGVDILPVVINGNFDSFGKDGKKGISVPHDFIIKILPPMKAEEIEKLSLKEVTSKMHAAIRGEHEKIAPKFYK